ncbi:nonsense-mediated mRNA decay protein 3 [Natronoarchaeum philippinense]|uniref:Nonsense-mediated mRNA decay protein 3 n=1 Tax=Natronoarchaeum philippinense TaxID=558529 RepID=A0A285PD33_NATPI|nr:60S ribosomal export protein NMD3 [Natronoarchaeum philippinense]SNZ18046.1 nonsense-mediated mRNA decay protein 3 [Natronoarchaeum philippinense]
MSETRAFCPRCGDAIDTPRSVREERRGDPALCDECYFEEFELIDAPDRVQVRVCATCGAVHRGNRWVDVGAEDYTEVAIEEVSESLSVHFDAEEVAWSVEPEQVDQTTIRMHCFFTGVVNGTPVEEQVTVPVKITRQTCDRCGRISGDYYASILQLRARDRTPTDEEVERTREIANEVVEEMEATGDRNAFVTDATEVDAGLNIKLSTNKIGMKVARKVVEEFGGSYSDSETLVSEDEDGNGVYRVTFAVRLPPYRPGEVIDPEDDDGPVLVTSARGNLKGTRLTTGERYEASYEEGDAPEAKRLGTIDDAEETTLVTVEDDRAVQVLDPETYRAKTIARPDYLDADAETVPVLKSRAGLHVLPEDDRADRDGNDDA